MSDATYPAGQGRSLRSAMMAAWRFNGWTTSASWWSRLMPHLFFRRARPQTPGASDDRRRLVRRASWTARQARRDRHDAYGGRPRQDRARAFDAASGRRSPDGPVNALGYLRYVRGGRPRRHAGPAPASTAQLVDERSSTKTCIGSDYLRGPRDPHRAGRTNRHDETWRSGVIPGTLGPGLGKETLGRAAQGVYRAADVDAGTHPRAPMAPYQIPKNQPGTSN